MGPDRKITIRQKPMSHPDQHLLLQEGRKISEGEITAKDKIERAVGASDRIS